MSKLECAGSVSLFQFTFDYKNHTKRAVHINFIYVMGYHCVIAVFNLQSETEIAKGQVIVLTEDEPSTDFGERIMPAIEWRRVSNFDILSLLLSW